MKLLKFIMFPLWLILVPIDCIIFKLWKGWKFKDTAKQSWEVYKGL